MMNAVLHARISGSGRYNAIQSQETVGDISWYGVEIIREAARSKFIVCGLGEYQ